MNQKTTPRTRGRADQEQRVWMTLSGDFKKRGAALLHQQCWCFGYDIRRKIGDERANLLLELGFERTAPPTKQIGATMYQRRESNGEIVTLWGFGMCFGDENSGVFVSRFSFWPRLGEVAAPKVAHAPTHLADFRTTRRLHECEYALCYFARALVWLADYEREVARVAGQSHRETALKEWQHAASAPDAIPSQWEDLARQSRGAARFWKRENNRTGEIARASIL